MKNCQIFSVNVWEEFFFNCWFWGISIVCFIHSVLFLYWVFFSKETLANETSHDCFSCIFLAVQDQIRQWCMLMLQSVWKNIFRIFCAWLCGPACIPACLFKMSNVVCGYMLHPGWALCKSTKIIYDNQCCSKRKTKKGNTILSFGHCKR